jgi:hypothetical protein
LPSLQRISEDIAADYGPPLTGRPSSINDSALVQELLEHVRAGNYLETAAQAVGISKVTVYAWLKRGEAGEIPFNAFLNAFEKAQAQSELEDVRNVRKAGQKEQFWAASMTHLERRFPERYGKRSEDGNSPKVVVQIGVQATDVSVTFASGPSLSPDPHNELARTNPTQVEILGLISSPTLTSTDPAADGHPAHPGHSLTGPAADRAGLAVDGGAERKGSRKRARGKKKGHA